MKPHTGWGSALLAPAALKCAQQCQLSVHDRLMAACCSSTCVLTIFIQFPPQVANLRSGSRLLPLQLL
jgi:hypothetical protein